jgi:hypothetical protein
LWSLCQLAFPISEALVVSRATSHKSSALRGYTVRVVVGVQIVKHLLDDFKFILLEIDDSSFSLPWTVLAADSVTQQIGLM